MSRCVKAFEYTSRSPGHTCIGGMTTTELRRIGNGFGDAAFSTVTLLLFWFVSFCTLESTPWMPEAFLSPDCLYQRVLHRFVITQNIFLLTSKTLCILEFWIALRSNFGMVLTVENWIYLQKAEPVQDNLNFSLGSLLCLSTQYTHPNLLPRYLG